MEYTYRVRVFILYYRRGKDEQAKQSRFTKNH